MVIPTAQDVPPDQTGVAFASTKRWDAAEIEGPLGGLCQGVQKPESAGGRCGRRCAPPASIQW